MADNTATHQLDDFADFPMDDKVISVLSTTSDNRIVASNANLLNKSMNEDFANYTKWASKNKLQFSKPEADAINLLITLQKPSRHSEFTKM